MKIFFCFFFFCSFTCFSQEFKGRISYQFVQDGHFDKVAHPNPINENRDLYFNNEISVFNNFVFADTAFQKVESNFGLNKIRYSRFFYKKNLKRDELLYQSNNKASVFVIEKIPTIEWQLSEETKVIGKFTCLKATAEFRGRKWTAWYAPEIPISHGPWKLHGLPGLILQAHDELNEVQFLFTSLEIPFDVKEMLSLKEVGTQVSFEEYKKNPDGFWTGIASAELSEKLQTQVKVSKQAIIPPIELSFE